MYYDTAMSLVFDRIRKKNDQDPREGTLRLAVKLQIELEKRSTMGFGICSRTVERPHLTFKQRTLVVTREGNQNKPY